MIAPRLALVLALIVLFAGPTIATAQGPPPADGPIDAKARAEVIEGLAASLEKNYVFPDVAAKLAADLRRRQQAKEFDAIATGRRFAEVVTGHLQAIGKDKHLYVQFSSESLPVPAPGARPGPSAEERAGMAKFASWMNHGFLKVERMEGNVGYLQLDGFLPVDLAGETASAAMTMLSHSDALIVDLRTNGGGEPAMVAFLTSYLFDDGDPVHLNDLDDRAAGRTHQWWTLPYVPGRRLGAKPPVYVLTGARTFSAAEEFAYNLKALKRATIVGETTGGGAHDGDMIRLADHFSAYIPSRRAVNPITRTNWEGTGVVPDLAIAADLAPKAAHVAALEEIVEAEQAKPGGDSMRTDRSRKTIERLRKELDEARGQGAGRSAPRK